MPSRRGGGTRPRCTASRSAASRRTSTRRSDGSRWPSTRTSRRVPACSSCRSSTGLNRIDEPEDLDAGWHPLLRDDAERRAGYGPEAVGARFHGVVSRLTDRLPGEPAQRLVPIWTVPDGATSLETYVATRVVELVVHTDDLASSVGLAPVSVPGDAATAAIGVFVEMARCRSGDLDVIRAFARSERATEDALRVL
jgi:hypothetical protein